MEQDLFALFFFFFLQQNFDLYAWAVDGFSAVTSSIGI